MEDKTLLVGLLETVLGRGKKTSKDNYAYTCPFCLHKNPKLEINVSTTLKGENPWHCWVCEAKGKSIETLFKKLKVPSSKLYELKTYVKRANNNNDTKGEEKHEITLPEQYVSLAKEKLNSLTYRQAIHYLAIRGIKIEEIIKYNIGYCESGRYANRIIVPSYDATERLNYFIARSFEKEPSRKYDAPKCNKNELIGFENLINWQTPVILCEGAFDAIAIKRNAIPLFGKLIPTSLKIKLLEPQIKTVYLALDNDALKYTIKYAQELINLGKEVYLVELDGKDPSEVGFKQFTEYLHSAVPLNFKTILSKKLQFI